MLYMVECDFEDPAQEIAWNDWYSGQKLAELLMNPGFTATQRFRAITPRNAIYLAIHSIASAEVFSHPAYKAGGHGRFGDWDPDLITNWSRRLFDGVAESPPVGKDERLLIADGDVTLPPDVDVIWLDGLDWAKVSQYKNAVALDASVAKRGIAVVPKDRAADLVKIPGVTLYEPLTPLKRK
jgi:hypothetical protein